MKSYYEILNVPENASKAEIKKQYRTLVRIYHPDVNPSFEAQDIFKSINRAAEVLLDDEKRKNYDSLRNLSNCSYTAHSTKYTYGDLFNKPKQSPQNGKDISLDIEITVQEAILGAVKIINIAQNSPCGKCMGKKFINGEKCSLCNGTGEISTVRKITLKIPPSIKNKAKLRLKGEGHFGKFGGKNGNLYITINIEKNEDLTIKNGIVYYSAKIAPYRAVLGGNVKVLTLWGEAVIKIPPLTKANQSFKLIEAGVYNRNTGKNLGKRT